MNVVLGLLRLFFFGNFFIATGAIALTHCSSLELIDIDIHPAYYGLVFCSTLFIYNLQRFFITNTKNTVLLEHTRRWWIQKNKKTILIILGISFTGIFVFFVLLQQSIFLKLFPLFILSLAYFLPPTELRKKPWAKTFVLSLVWTGSTAYLPMVLNDIPVYTLPSLLHLFSRFFFMTGICMIFDLRDIHSDKKEGTQTIALVIGESNTRRLCVVFMLLHGIIILIQYQMCYLLAPAAILLVLSVIINTWMVANAGSKSSEYYYIAGIDGTIIIQWLFLFLSSIIL